MTQKEILDNMTFDISGLTNRPRYIVSKNKKNITAERNLTQTEIYGTAFELAKWLLGQGSTCITNGKETIIFTISDYEKGEENE